MAALCCFDALIRGFTCVATPGGPSVPVWPQPGAHAHGWGASSPLEGLGSRDIQGPASSLPLSQGLPDSGPRQVCVGCPLVPHALWQPVLWMEGLGGSGGPGKGPPNKGKRQIRVVVFQSSGSPIILPHSLSGGLESGPEWPLCNENQSSVSGWCHGGRGTMCTRGGLIAGPLTLWGCGVEASQHCPWPRLACEGTAASWVMRPLRTLASLGLGAGAVGCLSASG